MRCLLRVTGQAVHTARTGAFDAHHQPTRPHRGVAILCQIVNSNEKVVRAQIKAFGHVLDPCRLNTGIDPNTELGLLVLRMAPTHVMRWRGSN